MAEAIFKFYRSEEAKSASSEAKIPRAEDAGFDLICVEPVSIQPGDKALISTGLHVAIPLNWVGLVRDRSSIASRGGVTAGGVIDSGYRGQIKVVMYNLGKDNIDFKPGDRVAQLVTLPHLPYERSVEVAALDDLGSSERGAGGFGSTGK
ncbi:MAG: dUTP diphosphatase [Deltaproteobacteria bacterium]|nr:dUTP diphosphatase [Deltaproteobacteria bacterium]